MSQIHPCRSINYMELTVGTIVHFEGNRFEIVHTQIILKSVIINNSLCTPQYEYMQALGKWIGGRAGYGLFDPTKTLVLQGNGNKKIAIEIDSSQHANALELTMTCCRRYSEQNRSMSSNFYSANQRISPMENTPVKLSRPLVERLTQSGVRLIPAQQIDDLPTIEERKAAVVSASMTIAKILNIKPLRPMAYGLPVFAAFMTAPMAKEHPHSSLLLTPVFKLPLDYCEEYKKNEL